MTLIALQRILKAADSFVGTFQPITFWFLLLDTTSSAHMLAPSGPQAASWRLTSTVVPLPPFVYLGFNQMARELELKTAGQAMDLEHLKQFGRPVSLI